MKTWKIALLAGAVPPALLAGMTLLPHCPGVGAEEPGRAAATRAVAFACGAGRDAASSTVIHVRNPDSRSEAAFLRWAVPAGGERSGPGEVVTLAPASAVRFGCPEIRIMLRDAGTPAGAGGYVEGHVLVETQGSGASLLQVQSETGPDSDPGDGSHLSAASRLPLASR